MRRLSAGLIGTAVLFLVLQPATPGSAGARRAGAPVCGENWGVNVSPSPAGGSQLEGVSAISSKDVWTVGVTFSGILLAEHWDGTSWTVVSTPNPGPPGNQNLFAVSGAAGNDVWAVGYYNDNNGRTLPLILHWDGTSWTLADVPVRPGHVYELFGVAAISTTDVWAVGVTNAGAPTSVSSNDRIITVALHWDGTSWSQVPTESPSKYDAFQGVGGTSSNNVWAVGTQFGDAYEQKTLTEHWNGTKWTVVPSPNLGGGESDDILAGVSGVAANDMWAVGNVSMPTQAVTLAMHWDGTSWTIADTPNPGANINQLMGVSAATSDNVYAVGDSVGWPGHPQQSTLIERWNGTSWTLVDSPNPSGDVNFLYAVSARHNGGAWAVGNEYNEQKFQEDTLIESTPPC
jgi:hypothetical protein